MNRDDLRQVHRDNDCPAAHHPDPLDPMGDTCICLIRHVTDDELREMGYIKTEILGGIHLPQ